MTTTISNTDRRNALVQHRPDGGLYIVREASVWEGDRCVGTRIVEAAGPIYSGDIAYYAGEEPTSELFDQITDWHTAPGEDAGWLQAEDEAGRLTYPVGAR
jgi:hypothetical protein